MEIEKCFKRLLIKNPFYGLFCLSLPKVITRKVPTLQVAKQGINFQLNINPDFWERHSDDEQLALLTHELSHIALQHIFLYDSFANPKYFNVAADCEVNSYIENLPKDAMTAEFLGNKLGKALTKGMGTKVYYEAIQDFVNQQQSQAKSPLKPCNGGCGGDSGNQNPQSSLTSSQADQDTTQQNKQSGNTERKEENPPSPSQQEPQSQNPQEGQHESGDENNEETQESQHYPEELEDDFQPIDDHSTWKEFKNIPEATQQLMQNNLNSVLKATAEQVEKMRGTIPGELSEIIEKLRRKKPEVFNWKAYFRRLLGSVYDVNIRSTRRKESKRFEGSAGIQHKKKVSILVAVDTSGSISEKELKDFFNEIDYVYNAGARVTLIQCDTEITDVREYDGKNIPEIKGRGGTRFDPPIDYYIKHRKEYAALVYFTDGYCSLPQKHPQGIVWVISSNGLHQDYPGQVVYIPKCEEQDNY